MKKNDCLELTAVRLGADLEGIGLYEEMPVFVPGLLPGESGLIRIVKVEKKYAFGRLERMLSAPSPDRQTPDCPVFPRCGGCSCRHMTYEATLRAKERQVSDCLSRIGGVTIPVLPILGMDHPSHYRNKIALPVGGTSAQPSAGYYASRSHAIVPVSDCPNAKLPGHRIANAVLDWMSRYAVAPYDEQRFSGLLRHIVIRISRDGLCMVTLVANASSLPHLDSLIPSLAELGVSSLWINENRARNNVILSDRFHHIYGSKTIEDVILGIRFELSPASFFQVNPEQTDKLYETAAAFAALSPSDTLCDLYCGAGTISLTVGRSCRRVVGIEIVPEAVENARRNALLNHMPHAEFHAGKTEVLLPRMIQDGFRPDVIIADPPRKGMEPSVIQTIAEASPRRLVYVSCNPATLARDVRLLAESGFRVDRVQPVDMFCWTSGIETVCLLLKTEE